MTTIYGRLGIAENEADRVYVTTLGRDLVYDAVNEYAARINAEVAMAESLFVATATENYTERYKLPGGGYLEETGPDAIPAAAKASGSWDVAYPLRNYARQLAANDITFAYMTAAEFQRSLTAASNAYVNTRRREMLRALFRNTALSFVDEVNGTLTVQPLANGDSVLYPPTMASDAEATESHYLATGYTSISNTNDPYVTITAELEEHFGLSGGSGVLVFINGAQQSETAALSDFVPVPINQNVVYGDDVTLSSAAGLIPAVMDARVLGTHGEAGCTIVRWDRIPASYMLAVHTMAPAPLKERVDPAATGLPRGFNLMARKDDWPSIEWYWRARFGFGVGNRLNGVAAKLTASSYDVPTTYA